MLAEGETLSRFFFFLARPRSEEQATEALILVVVPPVPGKNEVARASVVNVFPRMRCLVLLIALH